MIYSQGAAAAAGLIILGIVAAPVVRNWRNNPADDFPLSHYPMFSARRRKHGHVVHVVAQRSEGVEENVPYTWIGEGGFNQVRRQVAKRAKTPEGANDLAREVSDKLSALGDPVVEVRVLRSSFNYDEFFAGRREPVRVRVLGSWGDQR